MNAVVNITIRARAAEAKREIAAARTELAALEKMSGGASRAATGLISNEAFTRLASWGSQLQWTGRQLTTNFTLPIAASGGIITKWVLEQDAAMTRLQKVYGDSGDVAGEWQRDVEGLGKAFDLLSVKYATSRKDVAEIAGDWAAAGAVAGDLATGVEQTLKTMVLGEMNAAESTEALIAIQAQYGAGSAELTNIINQLNATENATGVTFQGLVQGMARSAGAARTAGVDVQHLTAMIAALVPATGGAEQAGNALKTMISRIMAPTGAASEVMEMMGINIEDAAWKSSSATTRIETLAKAFHSLEGASDSMVSAQAAEVSAQVASRWNINRFDVLMRDVYNAVSGDREAASYYGKTLEILSDTNAVFQTAQNELRTVLESDTYAVKRAGVVIQNSLIKVIAMVMPQILEFVNIIAKLTQMFANLDPGIQKGIIAVLAFLAVLGPPIVLISTLGVAVGRLGMMFTGASDKIKDGLGAFKLFRRATAVTATTAAANAGATTAAVTTGATAQAAAAASTATAEETATARKSRARALDLASLRTYASSVMTAGSMVTGKQLADGALQVVGIQRTTAVKSKWALDNVAADGVAAKSAGGWSGAVKRAHDAANISAVNWLGRWRAAQTGASTAATTAANTISSTHAKAATAMSWAWEQGSAKVIAAGSNASTILPRLWDGANAAMLRSSVALHNTVNGLMDATIAGMTVDVAKINAMAAGTNAMGAGAIAASAASGKKNATAAAAAKTAGTAAGAATLLGFSSKVKDIPAAAGAAMKSGGATIATTVKAWGATVATAFRGLAVKGIAALAAGVKGIPVLFARIMPAVGRVLMMGLRFLTGPWGLAISAIIALIVAFKDQIGQFFTSIVGQLNSSTGGFARAWTGIKNIFQGGADMVYRAFRSLPEGVQGSLTSVVNMVRSAAEQVYEWFSYFNPFQRHSPSLVENVTRGMAVVGDQFGIASAAIKRHALDAYGSFKMFGGAVAGFMARYEAGLAAEDRQLVSDWVPEAVGQYDNLLASLGPLRNDLGQLKNVMDEQENAVANLKVPLDAATKSYDAMSKVLQRLEDDQSRINDALSAAKDALDSYASSPISGMREMSDAMFDNEMRQKKLQLALMDWEKVNGSIDDVKSRMASLQGDIESLRGTSNDLTAAGAGSDILGPIKSQISQMEAAYDAMGSATANSPVAQMQDELEKLKKEGERLDLENSIKFDPLTRQIEQLSTVYKELPFDQIVAGIKSQSAEVANLQAQYDAASTAVDSQRAAVDAASASVESAQAAYDAASASLDGIKTAYSAVEAEINAIEEAIRRVVDAASAMQSALEAAQAAERQNKDKVKELSNFEKLAGGAYEDTGGSNIIGGDGQSIDDWLAEFGVEDMFNNIDVFKGIKDAWAGFQGWWTTNVNPVFNNIGIGIADAWRTIDWSGPQALWDKAVGWWNTLTAFVSEWAGKIWGLFGPQFSNIWENIKSAWGPAIDTIKEAIKPLGETFGKLWDTIKDLYVQAAPVFKWIGVALGAVVAIVVGILSGLFRAIGNAIGPIIEWVANMIGSIIQVIDGVVGFITGVIQFVSGVVQTIVGLFTGIFTGDWTGLQEGLRKVWDSLFTMFDGLATILGAIWSAVWSTIKGLIATVWGAVSGFVQGIVDFFYWLWDVLVGHSIVPDMVNAIIDWFVTLWNDVTAWVKSLVETVVQWFQDLWTDVVEKFNGLKDGIAEAWQAVKDGLAAGWNWIRDNVFDKIKEGAQWVWDKFVAVKDGAVKAWTELKDGLVTFLTNVSRDVFDKLKEAVGWVGDKFDSVKNGALAAWETMKNDLKTKWEWMRDNVFNLINTAVDGVKGTFESAQRGIGTAWNLVKTGVEGVWTYLRDNVFNNFTNAINAIGTTFDTVQKTIGTAWDKIKEAARTPVNFVIEKVYTNGIKKVWDKITSAVGLNLSLPSVDTIPAFANGSEDHRAQIAKPGAMRLWAEPETGGEAYIPLANRKRGRSTAILGQVADKFGYSLTPYANGGFWNWAGNAVGAAKDFVTDAVVNVASFMGNPAGAIGNMISEPVEKLMQGLGGGTLGKAMMELPRKTINGIVEKAKGLVASKNEAVSGGVAGGAAASSSSAPFAGRLAGWQRPMRGGRVTSPYGMRTIFGKTGLHNGVDLAGGGNTYAANAGVVRKVGWNTGYGNTGIGILIGHGGGLESYYGHNPSMGAVQVRAGQIVAAGQHIGREGATGNVDGVHLHYSVFRNGKALNPAPYYDNGGYMQPGTQMVTNATGRPEPVFTAVQWTTLSALVRTASAVVPELSSLLSGGALAAGYSQVATAVDNLARVVAEDATVSRGAGRTVVNNFYGDLSFPNITDKDHAEGLVRNLSDLAGE